VGGWGGGGGVLLGHNGSSIFNFTICLIFGGIMILITDRVLISNSLPSDVTQSGEYK
jgi:hypothetical protein